MKDITPQSIALILLIIVLTIWQYFWKGVALWKSANFKQRNWFIVLLLIIPVNTIGILELIYLFKFAKKKLTFAEVKSWRSKEK